MHGVVIELDEHTATVCCTSPSAGSKAARSANARHCYWSACTQPPERAMSPARQADPDLDTLIEEITVDATTRTSS